MPCILHFVSRYPACVKPPSRKAEECIEQAGAMIQVLDNLSIKAIGNRLDKRRLQHELDLHKLYLLTEYHSRRSSGNYLVMQYNRCFDSQVTE